MKKLLVTGSLLLATALLGKTYAQEVENEPENLGLNVSVSMNEFKSALSVKPNEANPNGILEIELLKYHASVGYQLVDQNGNILLFGDIDKKEKESISFNEFNDGTYYLNIMNGQTAHAAFVTVSKASFSAQLEKQ